MINTPSSPFVLSHEVETQIKNIKRQLKIEEDEVKRLIAEKQILFSQVESLEARESELLVKNKGLEEDCKNLEVSKATLTDQLQGIRDEYNKILKDKEDIFNDNSLNKGKAKEELEQAGLKTKELKKEIERYQKETEKAKEIKEKSQLIINKLKECLR